MPSCAQPAAGTHPSRVLQSLPSGRKDAPIYDSESFTMAYMLGLLGKPTVIYHRDCDFPDLLKEMKLAISFRHSELESMKDRTPVQEYERAITGILKKADISLRKIN